MSEIATRENGTVATLPPVSDEFAAAFPALAPPQEGEPSFVELLAENLGSDDVGLTLGDFVRVKVPAGGNTMWMVPDPDTGEENAVRKIRGILVTQAPRRSFWPTKEINGTPPTCRSIDLKIGEGEHGPGSQTNPTGECKTCPMSQRGSMSLIDPTRGDTQASACKEQRLLFVLPEGEMLPWMLTVPPGSLGALRRFMLQQITMRRLDFREVLLEVGLEKVSGQGVPDYARITFAKVERLGGPEAAAVKAFGSQLGRMIAEQADVISAVIEGTEGVVDGEVTGSGETVDYEHGEVPEDEVELPATTGRKGR